MLIDLVIWTLAKALLPLVAGVLLDLLSGKFAPEVPLRNDEHRLEDRGRTIPAQPPLHIDLAMPSTAPSFCGRIYCSVGVPPRDDESLDRKCRGIATPHSALAAGSATPSKFRPGRWIGHPVKSVFIMIPECACELHEEQIMFRQNRGWMKGLAVPALGIALLVPLARADGSKNPNPATEKVKPVTPVKDPKKLKPLTPVKDPKKVKPVTPDKDPKKLKPLTPAKDPKKLRPTRPVKRPRKIKPVIPARDPAKVKPVAPSKDPRKTKPVIPLRDPSVRLLLAHSLAR